MRWLFVLLPMLFAAACAGEPVVGEMSQDRVIVIGNGASEAAIRAEGARGCSLYNRSSQFMSWRCMGQYCVQKAYLFACPAPPANVAPASAPAPVQRSSAPATNPQWSARYKAWIEKRLECAQSTRTIAEMDACSGPAPPYN